MAKQGVLSETFNNCDKLGKQMSLLAKKGLLPLPYQWGYELAKAMLTGSSFNPPSFVGLDCLIIAGEAKTWDRSDFDT